MASVLNAPRNMGIHPKGTPGKPGRQCNGVRYCTPSAARKISFRSTLTSIESRSINIA
jgi:hypothetical protein